MATRSPHPLRRSAAMAVPPVPPVPPVGARPRGRITVLVVTAALAVTALGGCVTDRSEQVNAPVDWSPKGPACRAAAELTKRLDVSATNTPDPERVAASLTRLRSELPAQLSGLVGLLLSPGDPVQPDGRKASQMAWQELDLWTVTVCETRLLPESWLNQPSLDWVDEDAWTTGSSATTPVPAATLPTTDGPPPTIDALVASVAETTGEKVHWWPEGATGLVSRSATGLSITVIGIPSKKAALKACQDLVNVVKDTGQVDLVVRNSDGKLVALNGEGHCHLALGV